MNIEKDISIYLEGNLLYGDDFNINEIKKWYADEEEGYAKLGAFDASSYRYEYHELNKLHVYKYLENKKFSNVLGFGSAFGEEFQPIISNIEKLTIVDPSDSFVRDSVFNIPTNYIKPVAEGVLPLEDETYDLIVCFGVLHHIPNVSFVFGELVRVLRPSGFLVLREPINSMGDWRKPRRGLTTRERGIPLQILETIIKRSKLIINRKSLCCFSLTPKLFKALKNGAYGNICATRIDALLSIAFEWNINYHPRNFLQRIRPTSVFFILEKPLKGRLYPDLQ